MKCLYESMQIPCLNCQANFSTDKDSKIPWKVNNQVNPDLLQGPYPLFPHLLSVGSIFQQSQPDSAASHW